MMTTSDLEFYFVRERISPQWLHEESQANPELASHPGRISTARIFLAAVCMCVMWVRVKRVKLA